MTSSMITTDERIVDVAVTEDTLSVTLMDGRTINVPLVWYPRLSNAAPGQRQNWEIAGGGYGSWRTSAASEVGKGLASSGNQHWHNKAQHATGWLEFFGMVCIRRDSSKVPRSRGASLFLFG